MITMMNLNGTYFVYQIYKECKDVAVKSCIACGIVKAKDETQAKINVAALYRQRGYSELALSDVKIVKIVNYFSDKYHTLEITELGELLLQ